MTRRRPTNVPHLLTANRRQEAEALAFPISLVSLLPADWPLSVPLVHIHTCGCSPVVIEVLQGFDARAQPIYASPSDALWQLPGMTTAPILLEMLASQPRCVISQDVLMQGLRQRRKATQKTTKDDEDDREFRRPENVVTLLRKLLYPPALHHLPEPSQRALRLHLVAHITASRDSGPAYHLAGAPLVWLDVEMMEAHAKQILLLEKFGSDPLSLWEAISEIGLRGSFLPHEPYSDWAQWRRTRVSDLLWQSVSAQYQRIRAQEDQEAGEVQALRLLFAFWQGHITNEDAFRVLAELLGKRERFQQAEECYTQLCTALEQEGYMPHERTKQAMDFVRAKQIQRQQTAVDGLNAPARAVEPGPVLFASQQHNPSFSSTVLQGIIEIARVSEGDTMDQLRRDILQQALKGTGVAFLASQDLALGSEIAERLAKALTRPSHIDEKTLFYLEKRFGNYWQDRNDVSLPVWDLIPYVLEDLQKVTTLLEGSLQPPVRLHLCSIAGTAAMLIGELYYDMRKYSQARAFQKLAITAAHEANNTLLEAVAWGRNSFAWTYDAHPDEARNSIQQARRLARRGNSTVRTWLAALEAEIQSNLADREACLQALREAASLEDGNTHQENCYWIYFDQALFAGYQGISFLRLSNQGHRDLVLNAQAALQGALDVLDPSMKRRQPTLLIDLAGTYVQQKNIEQACACAIKAIDITLQIGSKVVLQRLFTLRSALDPWKGTHYVQDLDRSMEPLLMPGRHNEQAMQ